MDNINLSLSIVRAYATYQGRIALAQSHGLSKADILTNALAVLQRQQCEINRLQEAIDAMRSEITTTA